MRTKIIDRGVEYTPDISDHNGERCGFEREANYIARVVQLT